MRRSKKSKKPLKEIRTIEDLKNAYDGQVLLDIAHFAGFLSPQEERIYLTHSLHIPPAQLVRF